METKFEEKKEEEKKKEEEEKEKAPETETEFWEKVKKIRKERNG